MTPVLSLCLAAAVTAGSSDVARLAGNLLQRDFRDDGPGAAVLVARGDQVLFHGTPASGVTGAVIEADSGSPWHAWLEKSFFRPLGMSHTGYTARPVQGYSVEGGKVVPATPMSMTRPHAAGALVSNLDDLLKWN